MNKPRYVKADEFEREMQLLIAKGIYPLECISIQPYEDCVNERFFMPALETYGEGELIVAGSSKGYETRKTALAFVGSILDKIYGEGDT